MRWLGDEALRRYLKLKPPSFVPNRQEVVLDIRKTVGGAICDPEDIIEDVLDDNDFISIGKLCIYNLLLYFRLFCKGSSHCTVMRFQQLQSKQA